MPPSRSAHKLRTHKENVPVMKEPADRPFVARAKLFANGRSQAVRLPKEFRLEGKEVLALFAKPIGRLHVSTITIAEAWAGSHRSPNADRWLSPWQTF